MPGRERIVLKLLSPDELSKIERHLGQRLDSLLTDLSADADVPGLHRLTGTIRDYVTRGGKRVRPQLCLWAFHQTGGGAVTESVLDLACAWEIFHAFLLVHDDLIDAADTRRADRRASTDSLQSLDHDSPVVRPRTWPSSPATCCSERRHPPAGRTRIVPPVRARCELMRLFSPASPARPGTARRSIIFQSPVPAGRPCAEQVLF